jgi:hypothetical protein
MNQADKDSMKSLCINVATVNKSKLVVYQFSSGFLSGTGQMNQAQVSAWLLAHFSNSLPRLIRSGFPPGQGSRYYVLTGRLLRVNPEQGQVLGE